MDLLLILAVLAWRDSYAGHLRHMKRLEPK